jgi:hypothetical protein
LLFHKIDCKGRLYVQIVQVGPQLFAIDQPKGARGNDLDLNQDLYGGFDADKPVGNCHRHAPEIVRRVFV